MHRTLAYAFSISILCIAASLSSAQTAMPTADALNHLSTGQPAPHSNSAEGISSNSNADEDSAAENGLLAVANNSRALVGAPPLRMDETLRAAARAHAHLMVVNGQLQHQLPGEASLLLRIAQISPLRMDRAGENLAAATCASDVNEALMQSPPHRENLLDPGFNVAGIAAVRSHGRLYVVQDFAHEVPAYSAPQSAKLIGDAIADIRQNAGLRELAQINPPHLNESTCSLAAADRPNAHLLAASYDNRKIVTYTQSHPEALPQQAMPLLRDPSLRQFAVGSCYARNARYPTGMYWIAILLY